MKDVFSLREDVGHGGPHHVDQKLFVFLVEFDVGAEQRREAVKGNSEGKTPCTSLIDDSAVGVKDAEKISLNCRNVNGSM